MADCMCGRVEWEGVEFTHACEQVLHALLIFSHHPGCSERSERSDVHWQLVLILEARDPASLLFAALFICVMVQLINVSQAMFPLHVMCDLISKESCQYRPEVRQPPHVTFHGSMTRRQLQYSSKLKIWVACIFRMSVTGSPPSSPPCHRPPSG